MVLKLFPQFLEPFFWKPLAFSREFCSLSSCRVTSLCSREAMGHGGRLGQSSSSRPCCRGWPPPVCVAGWGRTPTTVPPLPSSFLHCTMPLSSVFCNLRPKVTFLSRALGHMCADLATRMEQQGDVPSYDAVEIKLTLGLMDLNSEP